MKIKDQTVNEVYMSHEGTHACKASLGKWKKTQSLGDLEEMSS
jgi:hypothetical protein